MRGMHAWKNFILEIGLVRYLEDPFAKYWVLGGPKPPILGAPNPPSWGHSAQAQLLSGRFVVYGVVPCVVVTLFDHEFFWKILFNGFLCRRHRKNTLWWRGAISSMGLGVPNMVKMIKTPVFGQKIIFRMAYGGYACAKIFLFKIRLVRYLEDPFAKSWVLGGPTGTRNTILRKNVPQKTRPLRPKNDN